MEFKKKTSLEETCGRYLFFGNEKYLHIHTFNILQCGRRSKCHSKQTRNELLFRVSLFVLKHFLGEINEYFNDILLGWLTELKVLQLKVITCLQQRF